MYDPYPLISSASGCQWREWVGLKQTLMSYVTAVKSMKSKSLREIRCFSISCPYPLIPSASGCQWRERVGLI